MKTYCRICEAACGLELDHDADGRPVRLRPDREHPVSRGFACAKGTRFLEVAHHPDRLQHPLRRLQDGTLHRVSWDDAVGETSERIRTVMQKHGPHAVGLYFGNPLAFNALGVAGLFGFMKGLGSRNIYSAGSQDCNNKFAGGAIVHGSPVIHPIPDLEHAELVVMFGSNPAISQSSFVHLEGGSTAFDRVQKRGGRILWIDPRRTESAQRWGEHLPIRSGTDVFLLLGLLHQLRDLYREDKRITGLETLLEQAADWPVSRVAAVTGLAEDAIHALVRSIRGSKATAFHMSVGVNQSGFGTLAYVALQALITLTGNFDRRGGSLVHPLSVPFADGARLWKVGTDTVFSRIGNHPSTLDTMPGGILADEILEPGDEQIRVLIVVAGDPLRTMPDTVRLRKAFRNLEWLAVIDLFETDTGKEADVLLPATSWLERFDVATTTSIFQHARLLQYGKAVVAAPGEARHEGRILADIGTRVGGRLRRLMLPVRLLMGMDSLRLVDTMTRFAAKLGAVFGGRSEYGLAVPGPKPGTYLGKGPRTPGHKLRFWDPSLQAEVDRLVSAEQAFTDEWKSGAFTLLGRRRRLGHNGWLQGGVHDGDPEAVAWLHPEDAAVLGLSGNGGMVRIQGETAALDVPAVANGDVSRQTIVLPHGIPGVNFNDLVPAGPENIDPLSGQHRMTGVPVQVTAAVGEGA